MRSLVNRMSDRLVSMVVPKTSASAAACVNYSCGCNRTYHLKFTRKCCGSICSPCLPTSPC